MTKKLFKQTISFLSDQLAPMQPDSTSRIVWDFIVTIAVLANCFFIPLSLSFQLDDVSFGEVFDTIPWWIMFFDVIVNMNTSYYQNGQLEVQRKKIIQHYLSSKGVMDTITILPSLIKIVVQTQQFSRLELIIFFRVIKLQNMMRKLDDYLLLSDQYQGIFDLIKLTFIILLMGHLLGCIWHYIAIYEIDYMDEQDTWLHITKIYNRSWQFKYVTSLYYAVVTMLTIGYGDITPQTSFEKTFSIFMMMISVMVFGYCLNQIGQIFNDMSKQSREQKAKLYEIVQYMKQRNINRNLQRKVRRYFDFIDQKEATERAEKLFESIGKELKDEVKKNAFLKYFELIKPLRYFSQNFREQLAQHSIEILVAGDEILIEQNDQYRLQGMYIVTKGEIEVYFENNYSQNNKISIQNLGVNDYFGADKHLFCCGLMSHQERFSVRTIAPTNLLFLSYQSFFEILEQNHDEKEKYCFIRDELIINQNYSVLGLKCFSCGSYHHDINQCELVTYISQNEKILKTYQKQNIQQSNKKFKRKNKDKYNSLKIQKDIVQKLDEQKANIDQIYENFHQQYLKNDDDQQIDLFGGSQQQAYDEEEQDNKYKNNNKNLFDNFLQKQVTYYFQPDDIKKVLDDEEQQISQQQDQQQKIYVNDQLQFSARNSIVSIKQPNMQTSSQRRPSIMKYSQGISHFTQNRRDSFSTYSKKRDQQDTRRKSLFESTFQKRMSTLNKNLMISPDVIETSESSSSSQSECSQKQETKLSRIKEEIMNKSKINIKDSVLQQQSIVKKKNVEILEQYKSDSSSKKDLQKRKIIDQNNQDSYNKFNSTLRSNKKFSIMQNSIINQQDYGYNQNPYIQQSTQMFSPTNQETQKKEIRFAKNKQYQQDYNAFSNYSYYNKFQNQLSHGFQLENATNMNKEQLLKFLDKAYCFKFYYPNYNFNQIFKDMQKFYQQQYMSGLLGNTQQITAYINKLTSDKDEIILSTKQQFYNMLEKSIIKPQRACIKKIKNYFRYKLGIRKIQNTQFFDKVWHEIEYDKSFHRMSKIFNLKMFSQLKNDEKLMNELSQKSQEPKTQKQSGFMSTGANILKIPFIQWFYKPKNKMANSTTIKVKSKENDGMNESMSNSKMNLFLNKKNKQSGSSTTNKSENYKCADDKEKEVPKTTNQDSSIIFINNLNYNNISYKDNEFINIFQTKNNVDNNNSNNTNNHNHKADDVYSKSSKSSKSSKNSQDRLIEKKKKFASLTNQNQDKAIISNQQVSSYSDSVSEGNKSDSDNLENKGIFKIHNQDEK